MHKNFSIRPLNSADSTDFFNLRLESLRDSPSSFLSSYEEEKAAGITFFENILTKNAVENVIFGAFVENQLIGALGIFQESREAQKHKCVIWGMYVQPKYRKQGIGKSLMEVAIQHAKNNLHCSTINLSVEITNASAKNLYESYGFKVWGIEPRFKKLNGQFYDTYHMSLSL